MSRFINEFKNNNEVKEYIRLRQIVLSNNEILDAVNCKLSDNKAKNSNLLVDEIATKYIESLNNVKSMLDMVEDIIKSELNVGIGA